MTLLKSGEARAVCRVCKTKGPAVPSDDWRRAKVEAVALGWQFCIDRNRRFTSFLCPACCDGPSWGDE